MTRIRPGPVVAAVFFAVLCLPVVQPATPQARPPQRSYQAHCASCHARDGSGKTAVGKSLKAQDLRAREIQKKTDAELAGIVREGKKNMPAFKTLTAQEVQDLITYIRQLARNK
jgi:mono/diheme cytochrome c family protein